MLREHHESAGYSVPLMEVWHLNNTYGVYENAQAMYPIATFPTLGEAQRYAEVLYRLTKE